jgi:hypothetical protein
MHIALITTGNGSTHFTCQGAAFAANLIQRLVDERERERIGGVHVRSVRPVHDQLCDSARSGDEHVERSLQGHDRGALKMVLLEQKEAWKGGARWVKRLCTVRDKTSRFETLL